MKKILVTLLACSMLIAASGCSQVKEDVNDAENAVATAASDVAEKAEALTDEAKQKAQSLFTTATEDTQIALQNTTEAITHFEENVGIKSDTDATADELAGAWLAYAGYDSTDFKERPIADFGFDGITLILDNGNYTFITAVGGNESNVSGTYTVAGGIVNFEGALAGKTAYLDGGDSKALVLFGSFDDSSYMYMFNK